MASARRLQRGGAIVCMQRAAQEVHAGVADEVGHFHVGGPAVDGVGVGELQQVAARHHRDAVGECHRLDLIVRDVDEGGLQRAVQALELHPHVRAQLGVQAGQRFVEQEQVGVAHHRAADGHALALSARQLIGLAVQHRFHAQQAGGAVHARAHFGHRHLLHAQRKADVLAHGHVRIQRDALEHHGHVAPVGRHLVHAPVGDADLTARGRVQPGDHVQRGGLAAAGRPEQHHELAVADVQVQRAHGLEVGIGLLDALQGYAGHISSASGSWRTSCRAHPSGRAVRWRPAPASWTP
ncbi:hypothetical protein G6F65_016700 [Rhizopus arrhizus]|nr:hypothetical protein G6F65_016700 [Rhizopus arrhizus]